MSIITKDSWDDCKRTNVYIGLSTLLDWSLSMNVSSRINRRVLTKDSKENNSLSCSMQTNNQVIYADTLAPSILSHQWTVIETKLVDFAPFHQSDTIDHRSMRSLSDHHYIRRSISSSFHRAIAYPFIQRSIQLQSSNLHHQDLLHIQTIIPKWVFS